MSATNFSQESAAVSKFFCPPIFLPYLSFPLRLCVKN
jgi:hypothetical protein